MIKICVWKLPIGSSHGIIGKVGIGSISISKINNKAESGCKFYQICVQPE